MKIASKEDGIAWVTGASSGIGREVALQLAASGWVVAVSARRGAELESLAAQYPGRIIAAPLDVTSARDVSDTLAAIEASTGRPVARAIFSAGTYLRDTAGDFSADRFKTQVDVNLIGTANCIATLLPGFIGRGRGQFGIVASLAGLSGLPGSVSYSATKAALIAMAQSLKFDLDKHDVGISIILPGFVKTPLTDKNDFPMPLLMQSDVAAKAILRGMDRGKFLIAFPAGLAWPLRFLRLLPSRFYFAAVSRATNW